MSIKLNGLNLGREVAAAQAAQAAAEAAAALAEDISNIDTADEVVEQLVAGTGGAGPLTRAALLASIEAGVEEFAPSVALSLIIPDDARLLVEHDFEAEANTAPGTISNPDTGPAYSLTGGSAGTARILDGQFVSPNGVAYAIVTLAERPDCIIVDNIFTGSSGPTFGIMDGPLTTTWSGPHIQTTKTAVNPFVFDGGTNAGTAVPATYTARTSPVLALANGVKYRTRTDFDWDNNTYTTTVTRLSDGKVLGVVTSTQITARTLSALVGAGPYSVFIEPAANVGYTYWAAFKRNKVQVVPPVHFSAGLTGPLGLGAPDLGVFDRVGIGTAVPDRRLVVSGTQQNVARFESSHTSGINVEIVSTLAGAAPALTLGTAGTPAMVKLGTPTAGVELEISLSGTKTLGLVPSVLNMVGASGADTRIACIAPSGGFKARLQLRAGSNTTAEIYQAASASDLRLQTGGNDRVIVTSAGLLNILGGIDHDGSTLGVLGTTPAAKQVVSGSRDLNAALASLLSALATFGFITDSTTA